MVPPVGFALVGHCNLTVNSFSQSSPESLIVKWRYCVAKLSILSIQRTSVQPSDIPERPTEQRHKSVFAFRETFRKCERLCVKFRFSLTPFI